MPVAVDLNDSLVKCVQLISIDAVSRNFTEMHRVSPFHICIDYRGHGSCQIAGPIEIKKKNTAIPFELDHWSPMYVKNNMRMV